MSSQRSLRSLLYVPGSNARMLEKARTLPADVIIFDLEDAVAPDMKDTARGMVREALVSGGYGSQLAVRVNALATGLMEADLEEIVRPGLDMVLFPKVETGEEIKQAESLLVRLEREQGLPENSVAILALVETALGVLNSFEIGRASERMLALCFGAEDFSRDMGAVRTRQGIEIAHARGHIVLAARAAGILAIDTPYIDLDVKAGFLAEARHIRQMGYSGKLLIHPKHIELTHCALAPSEEEVAYARRVLEAFESAKARGQGVIALDGTMIDSPVVARAREILTLGFL